MPSIHRGSVIDSLQRLFETGTATSLSETQLLERFITRGDESAFESILLRHGPMVMRVCGRVLDDPHDVDDAFQATFLILVKKAGAIRNREVLGTWLYGVARRVAVRARTNARRRRSYERTGMAGLDVADHHEARAEAKEIRNLMDEELERLPERYRVTLGPLRPRRPDTRAGGGDPSLPGRNGQESAFARPRPASRRVGPSWPGDFRPDSRNLARD